MNVEDKIQRYYPVSRFVPCLLHISSTLSHQSYVLNANCGMWEGSFQRTDKHYVTDSDPSLLTIAHGCVVRGTPSFELI